MFHPSPPPLPVANIHYIGIYPLTMIHLLLSVRCWPTNSHIHPSPLFLRFIHAPLPPCPSHLQILFRVCCLKLCRQRHQRQLINFPFLLRGSTLNMQSSQSSYISSHSPLPSVNASPSTAPFNESQCPIFASLL